MLRPTDDPPLSRPQVTNPCHEARSPTAQDASLLQETTYQSIEPSPKSRSPKWRRPATCSARAQVLRTGPLPRPAATLQTPRRCTDVPLRSSFQIPQSYLHPTATW